MILSLVRHPERSLWQRSKTINDPTSKKIHRLIADMYETMIAADGIGIAAPQVGHNIRLFLVRTDDGYSAFINPTITRRSWRAVTQEEGCLSVPKHFGPVRRPAALTIQYTDASGKRHKERAEGLFARVLQHEFDHIDGILYIKKAKHVAPPIDPRSIP